MRIRQEHDMAKKDGNILNAWKRKILREDEISTIKTNQKLTQAKYIEGAPR